MSTERVSGSLAASQQGTPIDGPGEAGWPSAEQLLAELPAHLDEDALEFLRAEYEHLSNSFISNEASGETRVNVFLGLVGAGSAGLGFAADALKDQPDMLLRLVVVVASTLLLFGLGTLRRVMQRNIATTEHLNGLRVIRASYLVRQPSLISVMPFIPGLSPLTRKRKKNDWGLAKAGFLETVALANAALAGLAAAAAGFAQQQPTATSVTIGSAAALIAWMLQIRWAERVYEKEQAREAEDRFSAVRWWRRNLGEKANRGGTG